MLGETRESLAARGKRIQVGYQAISALCFVYADVSQVAADMMVQAMGDRTLSAISVQAAQGFSIGLMLGRLGLSAIRICRPVPFTGDERGVCSPFVSFIARWSP